MTDIIYHFVNKFYHISIQQNTAVLLVKAGCKEKVLKYDQNRITSEYQWVAQNGSALLAKGACIVKGYKKDFVPEKGITKVHSTIKRLEIRDVDAKKQTVSMEFTLTLKWLDPHIRTSEEELKNAGILLSPEAINMVWTPDLHIWNRTFSQSDERILMTSSKILSRADKNDLEEKNGGYWKTGIEMGYEIKTTVFCKFEHVAYPMDEQRCDIIFGSSSAGANFVLHDSHRKQPSTDTHQAANFDISISFWNQTTGQGNTIVRIDIGMKRLTASFILKYYIPCIAIVLVTIIGFIIPVSATVDNGRVGLLVTLFLTLINLFIYHMVI